MKAVRVTSMHGYDGLTVSEEPVPEPGEDEVVIRVRAASLNYRDTIIPKGLYMGPLKAAVVPLSDGAGEVVSVGSGVTRVRVGDRVAAHCHPEWLAGPMFAEYHSVSVGMTVDGMLAEYRVLPQDAYVRLPAYLSYVEAASMPCAAVSAWSGLNVVQPLGPGQTVLVQGTGGVALFGLQIAKALSARVLAITSTTKKARLLKELGADAVVNYRESPQWSDEILNLTEGRGVDKVVEIGGAGTIAQSVACTRIGGEIGMIGFVAAGPGGLTSEAVLQRSLVLQGIAVGPRCNFEALLSVFAVAETRPVIDSVYGFDDFKEAYQHLDSGSHIGKVVIGFD